MQNTEQLPCYSFYIMCELTVGNDCTVFQPVLPLCPHQTLEFSGPLLSRYLCLSELPTADPFLDSNLILSPITIQLTVTSFRTKCRSAYTTRPNLCRELLRKVSLANKKIYCEDIQGENLSFIF